MTIAITPDGKLVYVDARDGNTITAIDVKTQSIIATIFQVDNNLRFLEFTPDGKLAYVGNERDSTVCVIDTKTHSVILTGLSSGDAIEIVATIECVFTSITVTEPEITSSP
ncbi:beta-propeller fold lactonase family protein [Bacillus sp. SM2101]|uniref:YncE family protein n=1 Tax=Bacillus sp. SM2101 TaxID=2805366 RepID=UPI001BDE4366|nr:beta-propeller fold lactonase family protein [Bacillus sp. SM2101]